MVAFADLLPPIHETLTTLRETSSLGGSVISGSHHHAHGQLSMDVGRDSTTEQQQSGTASVVEGGGTTEGAANAPLIYTQTVAAATNTVDCFYSGHPVAATRTQQNTITAYHQGQATHFSQFAVTTALIILELTILLSVYIGINRTTAEHLQGITENDAAASVALKSWNMTRAVKLQN